MKDFFGTELKIGDEVAFMAPSYRSLAIAKIIKFTPKQVRVEYRNTWNHSGEGYKSEYLGYSESMIKKPQ